MADGVVRNLFSIRLICDRVVVRVSHAKGWVISEFTLSEAKTIHSLLAGAISQLEAGDTMARDSKTFLASLSSMRPGK